MDLEKTNHSIVIQSIEIDMNLLHHDYSTDRKYWDGEALANSIGPVLVFATHLAAFRHINR